MKDLDLHVAIFKGLGHPIRLKIACALMKKDVCCVSKMVECIGASQPLISQHLSILRNCGIIDSFRNGNNVCYKIKDECVRRFLNDIKDKICES